MSSSPDRLQEFLTFLQESLNDGTFVKLSLGHYNGSDESLKNIYARRVTLKNGDCLSFTFRHKTRDIVKNFALDECAEKIRAEMSGGFQVATLFTTENDILFEKVAGRKQVLRKSAPTSKTLLTSSHNRDKNRQIEISSYLHDLGITDAKGNIRPNAQDKFRQIDKYIEILGSLVKNIAPEKIRNIVDMGAGKGYLTFALYDYLTRKMSMDVSVTGVEYRADLVDLCNDIAQKSNFKKLKFVQGAIDSYDAGDANILIALHACDTATDDAIAKGIHANAELIVVAPCCHKQIRREMEKNKAENDLEFLLKYGTFLERQAEMATDGLRALILEYFGYSTKVFEFISDAHTPKNVLIVGTKNPKAKMKNPDILKKINDAKSYFGITHHHLEKMTEI